MQNDHSKWRAAYREGGVTASERFLLQRARSTFLSLWSYPNVYTDRARTGKGDGKELCDLLVVFGHDVLLFSDKRIEFDSEADLGVAWGRWYRKAVQQSAVQLRGAARWLRQYPNRVFIDRGCTEPLPLAIPEHVVRRVHLIVVARGLGNAPELHWSHWSKWGGGSSNSLLIDSRLQGDAHVKAPFQIGWPLGRDHCVHVLDDVTLDILLSELDTARDFISYLRAKEAWLSQSGCDFVIPGEEDLLAEYLVHIDPQSQKHYFPALPEGAVFIAKEGSWAQLKKSRAYSRRRRANKVSYLWDGLIEFQAAHVIAGTADALMDEPRVEVQEKILRAMAEEPRIVRRTLGAAVRRVHSAGGPGVRVLRTVASPAGARAYVVMSLGPPDGLLSEDYKGWRRYYLALACDGAKLHFPKLRQIVGVALDPTAHDPSIDYLWMEFRDDFLPADFKAEATRRLEQEGLWSSDAQPRLEVIVRPAPSLRPGSLACSI